MIDESFNRVVRLVGVDAFEALSRARVILFGVGGVGSWTAEALARTGVGHITIVDADVVCRSNINRQMPATVDTLGRSKVAVVAERLLAINPMLDITAIEGRYDQSTADSYDLDSYDYVVDAIDSLADKALLIRRATSARHARLFSSMGAALKVDPTKVEVAEFRKVQGCRLAAALRQRFKRMGEFPARKFKCVYSSEQPVVAKGAEVDDRSGAMSFGKVTVNGALVQVTAVFGLTLASLVINDITMKKN